MSQRIMPALVINAYVRTGLTPVRGVWYGPPTAAHALTAIALVAKRIDAEWLARQQAEEQELAVLRGLAGDAGGFNYLVGFASGFDGARHPSFHAGLQDGEAAWEALQHAELVK